MMNSLKNVVNGDRVEFTYNGKERIVDVVKIDWSKDYLQGYTSEGVGRTFNLSKIANVKVWGKV